MPLRDIVLTAIIVAALPICLARPWIGVLVWSWIGYMNPHRLTWGFANSLPFAQAVAIATIAGLLFTKDRKPLPRVPEVYLLLALWGHFFVSTIVATYPEAAWEQFIKVSKILFMTILTIVLLQDVGRLRALFWVIGLSIGFYGLKGGVWAVMTGGQNQVLGPPGSFIAGNTEIGLALNMVLPVLLLLRREARNPLVRHGLLATFLFSVVGILITYSRGALLALVAVLAVLFLKSRAKLAVLLLVAVAVPLAASTLPDQWFHQMGTIAAYEQERSAMGRLQSWYVSYRIALDHPLFGAGFRPFTSEMYLRYMPDLPPRGADAHSIFFQVLAEHGFVGLGLYVGLIGSCALGLRRLIRRARNDPGSRWAYDAGSVLEACLVAYVVGGTFLSLSYFDLFYGFVAATIILKALVGRKTEPASAPQPVAARPGLVRR